ncbi:MAG TPA: amidohydrolase family protein [Acidimicrobiales bacterium]|nr:amidohydrolase family protein [Acidimicrobiales bacterium]
MGEGAVVMGTVDADGHVLEPEEAWAGLPDRHRPRVERDGHGLEHVMVGDQEILAASLGLLGTPGSRMGGQETKPLEEALPGGFDPRCRLADMDTEGIDAVVLYPTIGLYAWGITDPAAAVAVARAYNDWLAGYCSADRRRLFGAAMVPLQDPPAAARELRRAHEELGFPAAFMRPNPCLGRSIADPAHQVIWDTAEELGVAIGLHEGSSVTLTTLGSDRPFNPLILHAVSHPFEQMLACAQLMAFGVMERHPTLRFVFLEANGGWAPFWLQRLDEQVHGFGDYCPEMRLRPSEYFARQCWISFEIDEATLPALAPLIGPERIVWGSDYPHHDATFPGATKELRETIGPLPPEEQARILGGNAVELYRLPAAPG